MSTPSATTPPDDKFEPEPALPTLGEFDQRPQRFAWAPGNYSCKCWTCGKAFIGDKRAALCAPCAYNDAGVAQAVTRAETEIARWTRIAVDADECRETAEARVKEVQAELVREKGWNGIQMLCADSQKRACEAVEAANTALRAQLAALQAELAAHNPGSTEAGHVFNQMRKAFVALGGSELDFKPYKLVELAEAIKTANAALEQDRELYSTTRQRLVICFEVFGKANGYADYVSFCKAVDALHAQPKDDSK